MKPSKRAILIRALRAERLCLLAFPMSWQTSDGLKPLIPGTPAYRWTINRRKPIVARMKRLESELAKLPRAEVVWKPRPAAKCDERIRRQYCESETSVMI